MNPIPQKEPEVMKSASLRSISQKMQELPEDSLRYHVLQCAKNFKTSWMSLGQSLYTVSKDKLFRQWGYLTFEGYIVKEIGIKKVTAMKLLRSYFFLEKEEPAYLTKARREEIETAKLPSVEAVDLLRKAKSKEALDKESYGEFRNKVLEEGIEAQALKRDLTSLIRQREEYSPEEAKDRSDEMEIRKILASLKSVKNDLEVLKVLPFEITNLTAQLIEKIEKVVAERRG